MNGFLFDENLPSKFTFETSLPKRAVCELGKSPTDTEIWDYARRNALVIVTKDADFSGRIILQAPPPWVVHLKFGNLRRQAFHAVLARVWPQVEVVLKNHKLVNVFMDRVEGVS